MDDNKNLQITQQPELPYVIVGLGNPGRDYRENRHNAGFMVIDAVAQSLDVRMSRVQSKAIVGTGNHAGRRIILAKPQTFMNLSGQAVKALLNFYKAPLSNLLLIHDDLDLPFGVLRLRPGGGSAGQKGVASTIQQLGTQDFPRLRFGIDHPPGRMEVSDYVLQNFSSGERELLPAVLERAEKAVRVFIASGLAQAMNEFNGLAIKD